MFKMKLEKRIKIIERAKKDKNILATDKYIDAQLGHVWFSGCRIQAGPNCNLKCYHCYGDYGPHRKGNLTKTLVSKIFDFTTKWGNIEITDGEPFRAKHKNAIKLLTEHSKDYTLSFLTNATFARNQDNSLKWFNFLKDNGYDLGRYANTIQISAGAMYKVPWYNYYWLLDSAKRVYPDIDHSLHLTFSFILTNRSKIDSPKLQKVLRSIGLVFANDYAKMKIEKVDAVNGNEFFKRWFALTENGKFQVSAPFCNVEGRALNIKRLKELYGTRNYRKVPMNFTPKTYVPLWFGSNGDVSFGRSAGCIRKGKIYGNIYKEKIGNIIKRMHEDEIYQALRLGGEGFLHSIATKIDPKFNSVGYTKCSICQRMFSKPKTIEGIRQQLRKKGVVKSYKTYIQKILE